MIAILMVLAAVILPTALNLRKKADSAKSLSNMKGIGGCLMSFAADNNNDLPFAFGWPDLNGVYQKPNTIQKGSTGYRWADDMWIWALVNTQNVPAKLFVSPSTRKQLLSIGTPTSELDQPGYMINQIVALSEIDTNRGFFTRLSRFVTPSRFILLSEVCFNDKTKGLERDLYVNRWGDWGIKSALWNEEINSAPSNFLFADGHVQSMYAKDTITRDATGNETSMWMDPSQFPNGGWSSESGFASWLSTQAGL